MWILYIQNFRTVSILCCVVADKYRNDEADAPHLSRRHHRDPPLSLASRRDAPAPVTFHTRGDPAVRAVNWTSIRSRPDAAEHRFVASPQQREDRVAKDAVSSKNLRRLAEGLAKSGGSSRQCSISSLCARKTFPCDTTSAHSAARWFGLRAVAYGHTRALPY